MKPSYDAWPRIFIGARTCPSIAHITTCQLAPACAGMQLVAHLSTRDGCHVVLSLPIFLLLFMWDLDLEPSGNMHARNAYPTLQAIGRLSMYSMCPKCLCGHHPGLLENVSPNMLISRLTLLRGMQRHTCMVQTTPPTENVILYSGKSTLAYMWRESFLLCLQD